MIDVPAGFISVPLGGGGSLILDAEVATTPLSAALRQPWDHVQPRPAGIGTGRGPRGVLTLSGAPAVLVKQCLRGGWVSRLNRERFFRLRRFWFELEASRASRQAGLPVAETLAVTLMPARPGARVWAASRWVGNAEDLARLWLRTTDSTVRARLWAAAISLLERISTAGLYHPDLNLGNFLMQRDPSGNWSAILIDFDRTRWIGEDVGAATRSQALARLARSRDKLERLAARQPLGVNAR